MKRSVPGLLFFMVLLCHNMINKESAAVSTPGTNISASSPSTTISPLSFPTIDFAKCGKSYNCFRKPVHCSSVSSCDAAAVFQLDKGRQVVLIQITAKHQYVAFGQNVHDSAAKMVKLRGQYCARGQPIKFGNFNGNDLTFNTKPTWVEKVDGVDLVEAIIDKDNVLICKYKRVIKPTSRNEQHLYDFNQKLYTVIAFGSTIDGSKPGYHDHHNYLVSSKKINFLSTGEIISAHHKMNSFYKAHGILMIIAYIFLASAGILMSRYLKGVTSETKIKGKAAWFVLHVSIGLLCLVLVVTGFIIIMVEMHGWSHHADRHHYAGLFAVIAFLMQPVMALARPAPDHRWRFIFNFTHRCVGMLGWILGGIAIIFAFQMFDQSYNLNIAFIVVTIVLCILLDVLLIFFTGAKHEVSKATVNKGESDQVDVEVNQTGSKNKEKKLLLLFLSIILIFALVVTIYLLYIIASL